jgi:hypothetical protein
LHLNFKILFLISIPKANIYLRLKNNKINQDECIKIQENFVKIDNDKFYFKNIFNQESSQETVYNSIGKNSVEGIFIILSYTILLTYIFIVKNF